jgi:hypothetical protein
MACPICETCGTQFAEADAPPARCPICEDERQYVGWSGQRWTTMARLAASHSLRMADDDGLFGIDMPGFAIPQRMLLLPAGDGNLLWECLSLVTDEAVDALRARGGVAAIAISHPHFYTSMVEWSEALGGVPILLHAADRQWVQRPSPRIESWDGDVHALSAELTLVRCGGHFEGSTAVHWRRGPRGGGALFPGDAPSVAMDRRHVAFHYSSPNHMPMRSADVRAMRERLRGFGFDDVYGFSRGRNIIGGGRAAVDASFERHLAAVAA